MKFFDIDQTSTKIRFLDRVFGFFAATELFDYCENNDFLSRDRTGSETKFPQYTILEHFKIQIKFHCKQL